MNGNLRSQICHCVYSRAAGLGTRIKTYNIQNCRNAEYEVPHVDYSHKYAAEMNGAHQKMCHTFTILGICHAANLVRPGTLNRIL